MHCAKLGGAPAPACILPEQPHCRVQQLGSTPGDDMPFCSESAFGKELTHYNTASIAESCGSQEGLAGAAVSVNYAFDIGFASAK